MNYLKFDLGHQNRGDIVRVTLTKAANVRLMTASAFQSYRNGRAHRMIGGLVRHSPYEVSIPTSGHWYVAVDMQGLVGDTRASVQVVPAETRQPLPPAPRPRQTPVGHVADNFAQYAPDFDHSEYDVFISHASDDKDDVVRPLAHALRERGVKVWYDEFSLKVGDSLRRKIDQGIANSKFGIVVISPRFVVNGWTNQELDGLMVRAVDGAQVLLPIWHNITRDEVVLYSPMLADKVALNTSTATVDEIAGEIASVIGG